MQNFRRITRSEQGLWKSLGTAFLKLQKIQYPTLFFVLGNICLVSIQLPYYGFYEALDSCVNYPFIFTGLVCT